MTTDGIRMAVWHPVRVCLGVAGVLAAAGWGCSRRETPAEAGLRDQTLLLGNGAEPEDLDPAIVTAYTDQNILLALFEGLTAIDEKSSQAVPAAAASWEVSSDGLAWTFHLRPGLKWSNGDSLTAEDFVSSWRRILDPALGSEYAYLLYSVRNAEAFNQGRLADPGSLGFRAQDPLTVRIALARPTPYLPILAAQPSWFPVNPRVLERFGAMRRRGTPWTRPGNLVGNGPFTLEAWKPNARIVTAKNPLYWNARSVSLNRIVFFPTESPEVEERDFRAGQLHVTHGIPVSKVSAYRRDAPGLLRTDPFLQTFFLRFNVKHPPFDDPRIRRALALAIDRDSIARNVLSGGNRPAPSLTPPDCAGYTARARIGTDPEAARKLLAEAGHPDGRGLPAFEVQARNDDIQPRVLEAIQAMWLRELGVHASIASLEQKTWLQNQQTLNYAVSTASWAGDFPDPVTFLDLFVTGGGNNWTGWGDARYDRAVEKAAETSDPAARREFFQKAEARLLEDAPITPLYYGSQAFLITPVVRGWEPALLGFHRYAFVRLQNP